MRFLALILFGFIAFDLAVWLRLHALLRDVRHRRVWRGLLAVMMTMAIGFAFVTLFRGSSLGRTHHFIPPFVPATIYIWHMIVLPLTALILVLSGAVGRLIPKRKPVVAPASPVVDAPLWSRRKFLTATALAAPPLASLALGAVAESQIGHFRVNRYHLKLPGWPRELDGFTITHVADLHAGVFSTQKMIDDVRDATNRLGADLILLGGDLINISHADLPAALDMVTALRASNGVYMVEGNHDCIDGQESFDYRCKERGVRLLLDEIELLQPRGVPIQLIGVRWYGDAIGRYNHSANLLARRDPEIFPIFLAHHPHCWDAAVHAGVPLTLTGHTHGGQIMLTHHIGAGPLRFRYWSGLYQRQGCQMIVSNGVGNWFPLRVNAPAEIVHVTLHTA